MKLPKIAVLSRCIIKNDTNANELCKQYFSIIVGEDKPTELVLSITKYVLTKRTALYKHGFKAIRKFNSKTLFMQIFSIKINTLQEANRLLTINNKYIK